jgi:aminoglycoside phosphotransferase (APT) family kinase protein
MTGGTASVVQRRVDGSDPTNPVARAARDLVRAAGLPVPEPADAARVADDLVVMLPLVDGIVAAELLRTVRGAQTVGRVCGGVAARLGAVNLTGVSLPRTWASGESLRAATQARLDRLAVDLPSETRRHLLAALDRSVARVDAARGQLVHGDLAPVNVLVRDDRLTAVLDLDRLQIAHPLYDAAWFAWVVSNYHPDVADAACDAFARAAGLTVRSAADLAWLWPLQLLERLAEAQSAPERAMWLARLESIERSG